MIVARIRQEDEMKRKARARARSSLSAPNKNGFRDNVRSVYWFFSVVFFFFVCGPDDVRIFLLFPPTVKTS